MAEIVIYLTRVTKVSVFTKINDVITGLFKVASNVSSRYFWYTCVTIDQSMPNVLTFSETSGAHMKKEAKWIEEKEKVEEAEKKEEKGEK